MDRPASINFLTERENTCLELLLQAQDVFDEICIESPQSPTDTYNFGQYIEGAKTSLLMRGVRRIDPENLLTQYRVDPNDLEQRTGREADALDLTEEEIEAADITTPSTVAQVPELEPMSDMDRILEAVTKTIPEMINELQGDMKRKYEHVTHLVAPWTRTVDEIGKK